MSRRSSGTFSLPRKKKRRVKVPEAMEILFQEESQRLIDMDKVVEKAVRMTEQNGIIFLDELDKVAGSEPLMVRTYPVRGYSGISCLLWKVQRLPPNTGW